MPEQRLSPLDGGRKTKDDAQTEGGKKAQGFGFDGGFFFIFIILIFFFMMPFGFNASK